MAIAKNENELLEQSLSYWWFYEKAHELRFAAHEILIVFKNNFPGNLNDRIKVNGLGHSFMLIMALSIENLIKSRVTMQILSSQNNFKHIGDIVELWQKKKIAHDVLKLTTAYNIDLTSEERELILRYKPFMIWAGRFMLPNKKNEIIEVLSRSEHHTFKQVDLQIIDGLFERMRVEMGASEIKG